MRQHGFFNDIYLTTKHFTLSSIINLYPTWNIFVHCLGFPNKNHTAIKRFNFLSQKFKASNKSFCLTTAQNQYKRTGETTMTQETWKVRHLFVSTSFFHVLNSFLCFRRTSWLLSLLCLPWPSGLVRLSCKIFDVTVLIPSYKFTLNKLVIYYYVCDFL